MNIQVFFLYAYLIVFLIYLGFCIAVLEEIYYVFVDLLLHGDQVPVFSFLMLFEAVEHLPSGLATIFWICVLGIV